jgi:hypothetical protein
MPTDQATARSPLLPVGCPSGVRGGLHDRVKGSYSENQRIPVGTESVGTNPLPRKGSRISGMGRLLAASTLLVTIPSATASQITE